MPALFDLTLPRCPAPHSASRTCWSASRPIQGLTLHNLEVPR